MVRAWFAALLIVASPALAQEGGWRHEQSGVTLPRTVDDLRLGEQRDLSGRGFDLVSQYGGGGEPITVYVYRSAYPNPALWFERTRQAMNVNAGVAGVDAAPRPFTLGEGSAPNGLREEIAVPGSGGYRSTAIAIAQVGEWIVKARISSATLDRGSIAARMDRLLAAIRPPPSSAPPHPLQVPALCGDRLSLEGRGPERGRSAAAASVAGLVHFAEARGYSGLAADPSAWCRETVELPAQYGSAYRRRDGSAWVVLFGDSGMAVSAGSVADPGREGAAAFASTASSTWVAALYRSLPDIDRTLPNAVPVLFGQVRGLAEITGGPPEN